MKTISSVAKRMYGTPAASGRPTPSTSPTAAPRSNRRPATSGSSGFGTKRAAVRSLLPHGSKPVCSPPQTGPPNGFAASIPPPTRSSPPSAGSGSPATTHKKSSPAPPLSSATPCTSTQLPCAQACTSSVPERTWRQSTASSPDTTHHGAPSTGRRSARS